MTIRKVAELVGVKSKSAEHILLDHRSNNFQIQQNYHKRGRKKHEYYDRIIEFITNPEALKDWARLTLAQRCRIIKFKHQLELKSCSLWKYYRRNGVKYSKLDYVNIRKLEIQAELRQK
jgi:transposase